MRVPVVPVGLAAAALGALALTVGDVAVPLRRRGGRRRARRLGVGERPARRARPQRARLPDRDGRAGGRRGRRAAEGRKLRPAGASRAAPLGTTETARAGVPRAPARPLAAAGRRHLAARASFALRPGHRTASTRRRGCGGKGSTSSCARRGRGASSAGAAGSTGSATTSSGGSPATASAVSSGERRNVVEAIVLGRSNLVGQSLLADFRASGLYHCLAVDGLKVATIARAPSSRSRSSRVSGGSPPRSRRSPRSPRTRSRSGSIRPSCAPAIAAALGSLAWLAARQRDRWQALLVGAAVLLAWNPYSLLDAGFQLSFAAVAVDLRRHAARRPRARGLSGLALARAADRRLDGVRSRDRAGDVAAVPPDLARHRPGERRRRSRRRGGARPRARDGGDRARSRRRSRPRSRWLNGWGAWFVAACARGFGSLPGAQITSGRWAAVLGLGAVGAAAYAWRRGERARAEAGLPLHGERPAEDRARAAAPPGARR